MFAVVNHLKVKPNHRNIDWLRHALQAAIVIEHSTLPLYCARRWFAWPSPPTF